MKEHKKAKAKTKSQSTKVLAEHQPNAAGIDLGAEEIWVAVPADRDQNPVRRFEAFTRDLMAIVQWLVGCGVQSVAMEATGVYWIPLYQLLEDAGLKVCLVNARHVKNVPGRKSDVLRLPMVAVSAPCGLAVRLVSSRSGYLCYPLYLPISAKLNLYGR
jgi:transposase